MMTREGTDSVSLMIPEGGSMYVERNFQLGSNCRLKLDGELSVEHDAFYPNALNEHNFFPGQNALLDVSFNMPNEEAVLEELSTQAPPFGDFFRRSIWVLFPWELEADLTLPAQVRLCVPHDGNYQGSLTIPEGRTLTISAGGEMLARGADDMRPDLDAIIETTSSNWSVSRMPSVDRNLLRLALYEMLEVSEVAIAVTIDESVELAKAYGSDESSRFVNGLLGRVARRLDEGVDVIELAREEVRSHEHESVAALEQELAGASGGEVSESEDIAVATAAGEDGE
jgi:N utilization substance protein B